MRDELVYRGDSSHTYAMSIAATWVWDSCYEIVTEQKIIIE